MQHEGAQHDDAEDQEDALQAVHPGDGAQAARGHVEDHDRREQYRSGDDRDPGHAVEQLARGDELHRRVERGVEEGHDDHEPAHPLRPVVVRVHVAGGDESVALPEQPLALGEPGAGDRDGQHVERGECVGQAVAPDQARVADERPPRERRRGGGQDEDPHRELPAPDHVAARRLGDYGPPDSPVDAVHPVEDDQGPDPCLIAHACLLAVATVRSGRASARSTASTSFEGSKGLTK